MVNDVYKRYAVATIPKPHDEDEDERNFHFWLSTHHFITRENWIFGCKAFEHWFMDFYSRRFNASRAKFYLFSRPLSLAHQDE
jgi:hypothetical protein